jgi:hypothetical protein
MSERAGRGASFRVEFDLLVLAEDSAHSTAKGRSVMKEAVRDFEERGIPAGDLRACEDLGPDGTRLPGCPQEMDRITRRALKKAGRLR